MNNWLIIGGVSVAAIIVSLFFEEGREFWEETFEYIFSFEWWGDMIDFFGGMFEDLGDFSIGGLIFGVCSTGMIYLLRFKMLTPFTLHMGSFEALFWSVVTYLGAFTMGYLVGKKIFGDD